MHRIHTNHKHYFILIVGLVLLAFLFFLFNANLNLQRLIIILTGLYYFIWGVGHHFAQKDLHLKVVLEYLLIAVIGIIALLTITVRI